MEEIRITDKGELKKEMDSKEFSVTWKVLSEIGPDWIGSEREVLFFLDEIPLEKNGFIKTLEDSLIKGLEIPEKSRDHVIKGEGDFVVKDGKFFLKYFWSKSIPYMDPEKEGHGEVFLDL